MVLGAALLLSACAEFSPDAGMASVAGAARQQLGTEPAKITSAQDAERTRQAVQDLLRQPVSADVAVRIALLNNRDLQAAYNDLGLAETASVAASIPPNPRLALGRTAGAGIVEWEIRLAADILALTTLPARREIARIGFAQAQQAAISATFRTALEARRAWITTMAARQVAGEMEEARAAAAATADLTRRLGETGAATQLEQARAGAALAETGAQLARARLAERAARERLVRALGLWDQAAVLRLPDRLPPLPRQPEPAENAEAEAVSQRVDLAIARLDVTQTARGLDLAQATRFVSALELAGLGKLENDNGTQLNRGGPELEIELPIFDGGEVKLRRETETYMRALNRLAAKAVAVRSEARAARDAYLGAHAIALQYQRTVLPLRRIVARETLLRYNGMLADVFDLLTEARERVAARIAATEAQRDFFLAEADLRAAIIGGGASTAEPAPSPPSLPAASGAGH
jgi:outer membrane protein TolC